MESKEQNKQTELKWTHRYTERIGGCQKQGGTGALGERGEGTKNHKLVVSEWSQRCKVRNIDDNIALTMYGAIWGTGNIRGNTM